MGWNNEADDLLVWLYPPAGVKLDRQHLTAPNARKAVSTETRRVEFEIHYNNAGTGGEIKVRGYALYYVCEDENGQCMFLRRDFQVTVPSR